MNQEQVASNMKAIATLSNNINKFLTVLADTLRGHEQRLDQTNRRIDQLVTALEILGVAVADLERRFDQHKHPVTTGGANTMCIALTDSPGKE